MQKDPIREFIPWRHLFFVALITLQSPVLSMAEDKPSTQQTKGLQQRIDFGSSHILGQSIKSGAVYLMHRKKSDIKSMLEVREHYRHEIIEDFALEKTALYGATWNTAGAAHPYTGGDGANDEATR
jgi:hypothetical protein